MSGKTTSHNGNLVPKVLSFSSLGARERETLKNAGHVSLKVWQMTKHNIEVGDGKSGEIVRIYQPLPLCYVLSSPRFWERRDQRFPGSVSLSLSRSSGQEGEDPGNEVATMVGESGTYNDWSHSSISISI